MATSIKKDRTRVATTISLRVHQLSSWTGPQMCSPIASLLRVGAATSAHHLKDTWGAAQKSAQPFQIAVCRYARICPTTSHHANAHVQPLPLRGTTMLLVFGHFARLRFVPFWPYSPLALLVFSQMAFSKARCSFSVWKGFLALSCGGPALMACCDSGAEGLSA